MSSNNSNIIQAFGFEVAYEDQYNIYYRSYIGYDFNLKGKLKLFSPKRNNHIIIFSVDKRNVNKIMRDKYKIKFTNGKRMWLQYQLQLNLSRYLGISKYKVIPIIDSGEIELPDSFDYQFLLNYLLALGFDIK